MEGIGLDNMLGAEEVEKLFTTPAASEETEAGNANEEGTEETAPENNEEHQTSEADFSDLLGDQPESVGSEENSEGTGGAPESNNGSGTPQTNLFSSITRILRDKGVFPDLSDEKCNSIQDEEALEQLFTDKVTSMLDERQQRLEKLLNSGATSKEVDEYEKAVATTQFLESTETYNTLIKEGEEGEKLRKQVMYQDYVNRGFKEEKAIKLVEKSIADGSDIEDAKDAFESCKEFYKEKVRSYQQEMENRQKQQKADEEKQYNNLKKHILDTESFYDGVKVDKAVRQKAYEAITKPVFKDEQGNYLTAIQKYQRENPLEFMENVAMLYSLTDGFKNVEKLTKNKVKARLKKEYAEIENLLNNSKRNGDGTLNLGNTAPDDAEREKWTLAI